MQRDRTVETGKRSWRSRAIERGIMLSIILLGGVARVEAETFTFHYGEGDRYRILSTVNEDVYVDRVLSHRSEILNRIAVTVTSAENGSGTHEASFVTSETSSGGAGQAFRWSREYPSVFTRDALGHYTIAEGYYMPVVRNVPVFPDRDLEQGDTWVADGEEVHDFRDSFGLAEPYRVPFSANYRYLGERQRDGKTYPAFSVSYRIFHEAPIPGGSVSLWPSRLIGASDQLVFWDRDLGQPAAYSETFRFIVELSNGRTIEYRGSAKAEFVEAVPMQKKVVEDQVRDAVEDLGIQGASVASDDRGVTISLEDIKFQPDSATLLPVEKAKIENIARILALYPDRDVLVTGHTALAGTAEGRQRLSTERAGSVADYLITLGARTRERILVKGVGAEFPIADNATPEGMKKNRRVEITLLEN